jgi:6-bladed beta-propeller protein
VYTASTRRPVVEVINRTVSPLVSRAIRLWAAAALAVLMMACGPRAQSESNEHVTVVRTVGVGSWGAEVELNPEMELGALHGTQEYAFGRISHLVVDASGCIYAYDAHVPALRKYDPDGVYVRTLGAKGSGPGEYKRIEGLRISPAGMIAAWDVGNARINLYTANGDAGPSILIMGNLHTFRPFAVDTSGLFYVKVRYFDTTGAPTSRLGYMRLTQDGVVVDTVSVPHEPAAPREAIPISFAQDRLDNFPVAKKWAVGPHGQMVVGVNDEYRFDIVDPSGAVVRVYRERPAVGFAREERAEWEALVRTARRSMPPAVPGSYLPEVPEFKPPYREIYVADDSRIWVHLYVEAEKIGNRNSPPDPNLPTITWHEPAVFDVFETDGTYLGEVRFPRRHWPMVMMGDTVWGIRLGEFNEQYVFRMRLEYGDNSR